jgi:serine/threonine protein kinase
MVDDQGQSETVDDDYEGGTQPGAVITDRVATLVCSNCGCVIDVSELEPFIKVECPDCGGVNTVPARLGHFLLLDLLGMGGMGGVYYAKDETLGRFVAIKVMLKSLGDDQQFIETFKREAQAVARLNHPHIAQIYSFGQEKGQPYIVMELVSGDRLDGMMETGVPLDQGLLMRIGLEIAEGLRAADEAGLVHGDIKPENILLDKKGQAKLVDFGLASASHQVDEGGIWGTPYYIAPEKVRRQAVDARADIYSLGATLYHALAGRPPFEGETPVEVVKARLNGPPRPLKEHRPDIDEDAARIVGRMLEDDLTRRYPTYDSVISDLRRVVRKLGSGRSQTIPRPKTIRLAKKRSQQANGAKDSQEMAAEPRGERGSRIVIRKSGGGTRIDSSNPSARPARPSTRTPEELAEQEYLRRRRRHRVWGTIAFLLAAGAITAAVGYLYLRREQRTEARREWFARSELMETATNTYARITDGIAGIAKLAAAEPTRLKLLKEHVLAVTGQPLDIPPLPPPVATAATNTAATNTAATNTAATNTASAASDDAAAVGSTNAAPATATPAPVDTVAPEDHAPLPDGPPIVVAALQAGHEIRLISRQAREAEALAELALLARNRALQCNLSTELRPFVDELQGIEKQVQEIREDVAEREAAFHSGSGKVVALRAAFDRDERLRLEQAQEQAAREQALAAQAEAVRLHQEKVDAELAATAAMTNAVKIQLAQNAFADAVKAIDLKLKTFETAEGQSALQVLRDRYQMLEALRLFLMRRMTEDPFGWGWVQGGSARDIAKADARGIHLKGAATPVPWSTVAPPQMLKLIDHYLSHPNTRASERGTQTLAAAVYCFEHGGGGVALAKRYFDKALDLRIDNKEAGRLLPFGW